MFDVFQNKRREPRVKIHTHVTVSGHDANGVMFTCETVTVDVSPHGAALAINHPVRCGTILDFATRNYSFRTRAVVRSVEHDRASGGVIVGLEYLDDLTNPVVIWSRPESDRPPRSSE